MPDQDTTPSPEPEPANAENAYIVISNRGHPGFLLRNLVYHVLGEDEQVAYADLTDAVKHLAYVHCDIPGAKDARLYRLIPVDPADYAQLYEMEIEAEKADQAAAEEPDFWDSRE